MKVPIAFLCVLFFLAVAAVPEAAASEADAAAPAARAAASEGVGTAEAAVEAAPAGARAAAATPAIRQAIAASVEQRAVLQDNREPALGLPDWRLELQADAEWRLSLGDRLSLSASPRVEWQEAGGEADGLDFSARSAERGEAAVELRRAEAALSLGSSGVEVLAGKLRPQFGVNYIEPLSVMNLRGRDSYDEGSWLSGLLLTRGAFSLEAYGQTVADPFLFAALTAVADIHEFGVLYRREPGPEAGHFFAAAYRGQIGDGLIPYGEAAFRTSSAFLDLDGQAARDRGGNGEALVGLGWSPAGIDLTAYLEYRYRQAGYGEDDWDRLGSRGLREVGAWLPDFPYLQTSRHAVGVHLRNQDEAALSWSATCIWLFPGLYAQAVLEAPFAERGRAVLALERVASFGGKGTEAACWPYEVRLTVSASWKIDANEETTDAL